MLGTHLSLKMQDGLKTVVLEPSDFEARIDVRQVRADMLPKLNLHRVTNQK